VFRGGLPPAGCSGRNADLGGKEGHRPRHKKEHERIPNHKASLLWIELVRWSWRRHSCLPRQDSSWRSRSGENLPAATHYFRMRDFHRRLPHQYPPGKWLFVTWHLHGSLPHAKYPPPNKLSSGAAFVWMDRYLDSTRTGPRHLG